ncbi:hypothetical protein [Aeromicrobium sp. 50.2.37]|uniref:hypothetical protein n=1 Tax=Aeromicrobium sp. 50.2.37 TaxID=2969305 RepID=UPI0021500A83|nr:hypothetical protein [Aeromicrobium sp. 50.2.37]MCR4513309.1 hypothetical protein [Aeromicrobium sp. 50.2.37]
MQARPRTAVLSALVGLVLVIAAMVVPAVLSDDVRVHWPPLHAFWGPRFDPLLLVAIATAVLLWSALPWVCRELPWRVVVVLATVSSWLWTCALGLSDGRYGFSRVYGRTSEYLHDATEVRDVPAALHDFVERIPSAAVDNWHTHVAGHPPGALLSFVALDRVGIDDPFWVAMVVVTIGATSVAAVLLTLDLLGNRDLARRAAPWLALAPLVVWAGVSADYYFAAVGAWGLYLLARAAVAVGPRSWALGVGAGLLLGWCVFLSYGLVLLGILALAVLWLANSRAPAGPRAGWRVLPWAVGGALVVTAAFSAYGFHWWEAYPVLRERYYEGIASERAYGYWVWANLAAWTFTAGLAVWAAFPAAADAARRRVPLAVLAAAGVATIVAATLSGMSKAEVERIWLPFTIWVVTIPALLPDRWQRPLLASQLVLALLAQTLLITRW